MTSQTVIFLYSVLFGFFLGYIFDLFRITRIAFKTCNAIIFIEDVIFFVIATISSFIFILTNNNGVLRCFLIVGELLGAIIYFFSLSIVIIKAATAIINFIKAIIRFLYKIFIRPIIKLFLLIRKMIGKIKVRINRQYQKAKNNRIQKINREKQLKIDEENISNQEI